MPESRDYRIFIWSLVIFVLVVAAPGWYIQMQLAEKMYHLKDRVATLEDRVATLEEQVEQPESQPADRQSEDPAMDTEADS